MVNLCSGSNKKFSVKNLLINDRKIFCGTNFNIKWCKISLINLIQITRKFSVQYISLNIKNYNRKYLFKNSVSFTQKGMEIGKNVLSRCFLKNFLSHEKIFWELGSWVPILFAALEYNANFKLKIGKILICGTLQTSAEQPIFEAKPWGLMPHNKV